MTSVPIFGHLRLERASFRSQVNALATKLWPLCQTKCLLLEGKSCSLAVFKTFVARIIGTLLSK